MYCSFYPGFSHGCARVPAFNVFVDKFVINSANISTQCNYSFYFLSLNDFLFTYQNTSNFYTFTRLKSARAMQLHVVIMVHM